MTGPGEADEAPKRGDGFAMVAGEQRRNLVRQALASLTRGQRFAIRLRYWQDLTFVEMGVAMGVTEAAAWQMHDRAAAALRTWFHERGIRSVRQA